MLVQHTATIDGRKHVWLESGAGVPVVLLHGIGSDARAWTDLIDRLSDRYMGIAWNMPGYGGADNLTSDALKAADYAEALAAFLSSAAIERAHFVGHSLGSIVLASLLQTWSGKPASLTMVQPVSGMGHLDPEQRKAAERARADDVVRLGMGAFAKQRGMGVLGAGATPEQAARHLEIMSEIPQQSYLRAWSVLCNSDIFPMLAALQFPVKVIYGSDDRVAPESVCSRIADGIANAALTRIEGIGHSAAIEAPDELAGMVGEFIDGVSVAHS